MAMTGVLRPGHAVVRVLDLDESVKFYTDVMGLKETGRDNSGRVYFKCNDERDHNSFIIRKAAALGISNDEAKKVLLGEKEPSMQFTTPEELGELAVFFCSSAGNNVRGVAWSMDGGWIAQ